jgi:hypothetical protein
LSKTVLISRKTRRIRGGAVRDDSYPASLCGFDLKRSPGSRSATAQSVQMNTPRPRAAPGAG